MALSNGANHGNEFASSKTSSTTKSTHSYHIKPVRSQGDLEAIARLFTAYTDWLGFDLTFQDYATEMATMPGKYAPPAGELLLACNIHGGEPLGCVAVRPLPPPGRCEMKRLYVTSEGRGIGLGKALVEAVIQEAVRIGYREMVLDTLASMAPAVALYRQFGFEDMEPYYHNPHGGVVFLRLMLPG